MQAVTKGLGALGGAARQTLSMASGALSEANARAAAATAEQNAAMIGRSSADLLVAIKNFLPQASVHPRGLSPAHDMALCCAQLLRASVSP